MAKYAKDVNQRIKIIDVQKQFPGGLKTVDTDDALGQVYLREAENVSLSEFSFLEKRYGLGQEELFEFEQDFPNVEKIQGYFEYTNENGVVDKILFADGKPYIKQGTGKFKLQSGFYTEPDFVYPDLTGVFDAAPEAVNIEQDVSITLTVNAALVTPSGVIIYGIIADPFLFTTTTNLTFDPTTSIHNMTFDRTVGGVQTSGIESSGTKFEQPPEPTQTSNPVIGDITTTYIQGSGTYTVEFTVGNADANNVTMDYGIKNIDAQEETGVSIGVTYDETVELNFPQEYQAFAQAQASGKTSSAEMTKPFEHPAGSVWAAMGTDNQTQDTDDFFYTEGDFGYPISSSCPNSGFVGSLLAANVEPSDYPKGAVVKVFSNQNGQGFPQACPAQFYRAD